MPWLLTLKTYIVKFVIQYILPKVLGCAVWNAQWGDDDDIKGYMWQYTDSLNIGGRFFDGNIIY